MERIEADRIFALASPFMKSLVTSPAFFVRHSHGALYCEKQPNGVAFYEDAGGFFRMTALGNTPFPDFKTANQTVCEIVYRSDRAPDAILHSMESSGMKRILSRICLSRGEAAIGGNRHFTPGVIISRDCDPYDAVKLLDDSFSPLTGCLPSFAELKTESESRLLLCAVYDNEQMRRYFRERGAEADGAVHTDISENSYPQETGADADGVIGLLRAGGKNGMEIKQLAVDKRFRSLGIGGALLRSYLYAFPGPHRVWCSADNMPALSLYRSCGFADGGYRSEVFYKG